MDINQKFSLVFENKLKQLQKMNERVNLLKEKQQTCEKESRHYEIYSQQIRDTENNIRRIHDVISFMRPNNEKDLKSRLKIIQEYPNIIKKLFPDNFPIVFHGTNNIGTVREIIKSGGLLTPDQRNVSMTSFASAIDVAYKNNISVPCEFADAGADSFMPYGAIFAFEPQEDEKQRVLKTGDSTEVSQGVNGVNFKNQPNRLFGIITTPENIEFVQQWCRENSIDESKVFTHKTFIEHYKYLTQEYEF